MKTYVHLWRLANFFLEWEIFQTKGVEKIKILYFLWSETFFQKSTFLATEGIYVFVWVWEKTSITSLHSFNFLVFITDPDCVYCAVRTELYI